MSEYTFSDVCRLTGATPSNLRWWTHRELIVAGVKGTAGPGDHRLHSFTNLCQAAAARELNAYGISVDGMRQAIDLIGALAEYGTYQGDSIGEWSDRLTEKLNQDPEAHKVIALRLASGSVMETMANLRMWRVLADPHLRTKLAFAGITISQSTKLFGFGAQPKGQALWLPFEKWGHSVLLVNLVPILDKLEAATGDRLP
jgi:DNA-binding transcriptional MerR regulator